MATFVNGFRVGPDWRKLGGKAYKVQGAPGVTLILRADVAPLLLYAAREWNRRVEPLVPGWCWSFAYRSVRGSVVPSFHAACIAIDNNAPRHPLGVSASRTFSRAQIREIAQILDELGGTVRWGGLWSRPDGMHLEVIAKPDRARRVADTFREATAAPRPRPASTRVGNLSLPEDNVHNLIIFGVDKNKKVVSKAAWLYCPFTDVMRVLLNHSDLDRAKAAGAINWPVTMTTLRSLGGN